MPRTPPTICCPLPHDPRVFALAKASGLTTREAFAAAAESWAWMSVQAVDEIVNASVDSLDAVVGVDGFGAAMLEAGLVGTVDGGLVLPAELCRHEREQRGGRRRAAADIADADERRKAGDARRQRDKYWRDKLTKPGLKKASPVLAAEITETRRKPCRLGTVENYPVMLLWSRAGAPFYKLAGASPKEWTGTVTDPENPSYADALVALHATMKREHGKGLGGSGDTFSPSLKAMVDEAQRYRDERAATAMSDARRDEANRAAAEAAAEDREDIDHDPAERETSRQPHAHAGEGVRPHGNLTPPGGDVVDESHCPDGELRPDTPHEKPHADLTNTAPSSSSFMSLTDEIRKTTTTTSNLTPTERDHEDRILAHLAPRAAPARQQERHRLWLERVAAALGTTTDAVESQRLQMPEILLARLKAAGIDPKTGLSVDAGAHHEPAAARGDASAITEPAENEKPAAGSVDACEDAASEHLETMRIRMAEQLRRPALTAAAEAGARHAL